eukprot:1144828-Pelagomonas_calceolata.AAC.1
MLLEETRRVIHLSRLKQLKNLMLGMLPLTLHDMLQPTSRFMLHLMLHLKPRLMLQFTRQPMLRLTLI